ncbi:MAG TPA: hypothetical protein VJA21_09555 [Verrucomicrobiae bacterium]
MKTSCLLPPLCLLAAARIALAQGTFIFDQQSSDESRILEGAAFIQQSQPIGQSFTPMLTSVGFIRLDIYNGVLGNTSPATLHINLRADSITGPVIGVSESVLIPGGALFSAPVDFLFLVPPSVVPGQTYYFQPLVENNDNLGLSQSSYGYAGGTAFFWGQPDRLDRDLWFREGIVVPEPTTGVLALVAIAVFARRGRARRRDP